MTTTTKIKYREEWLHKATGHCRELFAEHGYDLPQEIQVSIGWPSKRATTGKNGVIGQCWYAESATDKVPHVFISPKLDNDEDRLSTLVHELIHAMGKKGHGAEFGAVAREIGLVAPMTATTASEPLLERLRGIIADLGPMPGGSLVPTPGDKQKTYLLKVYCPDDGYTMRITRTWLLQAIPSCPLCEEMMHVD